MDIVYLISSINYRYYFLFFMYYISIDFEENDRQVVRRMLSDREQRQSRYIHIYKSVEVGRGERQRNDHDQTQIYKEKIKWFMTETCSVRSYVMFDRKILMSISFLWILKSLRQTEAFLFYCFVVYTSLTDSVLWSLQVSCELYGAV